MRTYLETHPWLEFDFDLKKADTGLWIALGEAHSKCEHIAGVPLRPSTAKGLLNMYLARGVRATTAIEGNTLTEDEVLRRLEGKKELPPSKEYLGVEIDNILRACNRMAEGIRDNQSKPITTATICDFNRQVLNGLQMREGVVPGVIRKHGVQVGIYRGAPAEDCEYLLSRLSDWIQSDKFPSSPYPGIIAGIIKAAVAHVYFEWIHPFGDGNGRTGRLIELQILLESGVPQPAAHLLSNHYNATRSEYYRQLELASVNRDILGFLRYAVMGFVDGLREQLTTIRHQQWDITWENFIFQSFKDKGTKTNRRKRLLVFALSRRDEEIAIREIATLTPELAVAYHNRTTKTLSRDINDLVGMNLLETRRGYVRAKKETILAFLPLRKEKGAVT